MRLFISIVAIALATRVPAEPAGGNLIADGMPPIPAELETGAARYLEFRSAAFLGWHPLRREMLISTRFADTPQLHQVKAPGGARRQMTFLKEPVLSGGYRPKTGECIVFSQDAGGNENFQFHRLDPATGRAALLTPGSSPHTPIPTNRMRARWCVK